METLNQVLAEQAELIGKAKTTLVEAQHTPLTTHALIGVKKATIAELQDQVAHLTTATKEAVQQINAQIRAYEKEVAALQNQI